MTTDNLFTDLGIFISDKISIEKILHFVNTEKVEHSFLNTVSDEMKRRINLNNQNENVIGLKLFSDLMFYKEITLQDLELKNPNIIFNYYLYFSSIGVVRDAFYTKSPLFVTEDFFQHPNLLTKYYRENFDENSFELEEGTSNIIVDYEEASEIIKIILSNIKCDTLKRNFSEMFSFYDSKKYEFILQKYY
jgi:hypothetical protein